MKTYFKKMIPLLILIFLTGTAIGYAKQTNSIADKIVRFHIVAHNNEEIHQNVKWEIRKKIFENMDFENINSKEDTLNYFVENSDVIKEITDSVLMENNMNYKSEIYIGRKSFPIREYSSFVLPSGIYDTVSITLGEGKGENFFCVMYPSVCMVSSITEKTDEAPEFFKNVLNEEETKAITGNKDKTVIKFKIAELVKDLLSK